MKYRSVGLVMIATCTFPVSAQLSNIESFPCTSYGGSMTMLGCGGEVLGQADIVPKSCSGRAIVVNGVEIEASSSSNTDVSGNTRSSWLVFENASTFYQGHAWSSAGTKFTVDQRTRVRLEANTRAAPNGASFPTSVAGGVSIVELVRVMNEAPFEYESIGAIYAAHDGLPAAGIDETFSICPGRYALLTIGAVTLATNPPGGLCPISPPVARDLQSTSSYRLRALGPSDSCDIE